MGSLSKCDNKPFAGHVSTESGNIVSFKVTSRDSSLAFLLATISEAGFIGRPLGRATPGS
jgi:hypothetical protein